MNADLALALVIAAGAVVFIYLYHYRPRRSDRVDAERKVAVVWAPGWWIDWYLKISTIAVVLASLLTRHDLLFVVHDSLAARIAGATATLLGFLLFLAAMRQLGKHYTPCYNSRLPHNLVTTGPYRFIRHPIYVSNVVMLFGLIVATGSGWLALNLMILLGYYVPMISREERSIIAEFPEYADYAARTGALVPRLWPAPGEPRP